MKHTIRFFAYTLIIFVILLTPSVSIGFAASISIIFGALFTLLNMIIVILVTKDTTKK